jgi:hypothetical protein
VAIADFADFAERAISPKRELGAHAALWAETASSAAASHHRPGFYGDGLEDPNSMLAVTSKACRHRPFLSRCG